MTDSETLPHGLCIHCDALVYPGPNGLVRPGGRVAHRRCWRGVLEAEKSARRRYVLTVAAMALALVLSVLALAVFA